MVSKTEKIIVKIDEPGSFRTSITMDNNTVPFLQSDKYKQLKRLLLLVLAFCVLPVTHAGDFSEGQVLVLQSHDTQLKAGEMLPTSTTVRLAPEEMLRVMMPTGEVAKIQGAYTGSIGSALRDEGGSSINLKDLVKAVAGRGQSRKDLGAYRSSGTESGPPRYKESVVRIIVGENGSYCVSPGQQLALWRKIPLETDTNLGLDTGKIKEQIIWPAGMNEVSVSKKVVSSKPRRIILTGEVSLGSSRARLWFGEHGDTPGEQLQWYESRGCDVQFESALTFYQTF